MRDSFRTEETDAKHRAYRAQTRPEDPCPLCAEREVIRQFTHWKVLLNEFPYDAIAKTHHMIVPVRHVAEDGVTPEAWQEYQAIKRTFIQQYDVTIEAMRKSIPSHFHIHLIIKKDVI